MDMGKPAQHYHDQPSKYLDPLTLGYRTDPNEETPPGVMGIGGNYQSKAFHHLLVFFLNLLFTPLSPIPKNFSHSQNPLTPAPPPPNQNVPRHPPSPPFPPPPPRPRPRPPSSPSPSSPQRSPDPLFQEVLTYKPAFSGRYTSTGTAASTGMCIPCGKFLWLGM